MGALEKVERWTEISHALNRRRWSRSPRSGSLRKCRRSSRPPKSASLQPSAVAASRSLQIAEAGHNVLKGKMVLFAWTDSKCGVRDRMVAASSQSAIKQVCRGSMDQPVHDKADMEYDYIAKELGCNR